MNSSARHRYPHMVQESLVNRVRAVMDARRERLAAIRTREDAEAYVTEVRRAVRRAFAPFPKRTPLNTQVTAAQDHGVFTIEKIVFESRPGFLVTGNLYRPSDLQPGIQAPAVLGLCGHAPEGKAVEPYQFFAQGLATKGFVVFLIDPISQGERRQFFPRDGGKRPGLCHAHNLMGNQLVLVDDFFGTWRVWDAIRALDVLLARPEVDRTRVGVTGNSGGGTLTTYLTALDPRVTMAAPSCYVCSWLANLENELPADSEQNPPGLLAAGLDEADLLLCYAPRPTLILSQRDDFFDERAARQAYEDVRRVHGLLGSPDSAAYFMGPTIHGYSVENREAMYGFFLKQAGMPGHAREEGVHVLPEAATRVLGRNGIARAGSVRVFETTAARAVALRRARGRPSASRVTTAAARLLGIPQRRHGEPHYRIVGPWLSPDKPQASAQFAVETEPGIQALVSYYRPSGRSRRLPQGALNVYVGHLSGEQDVAEIPAIRRLAAGSTPLMVVDPRGIGQSCAATCRDPEFLAPYGSDYLYAATGEMLGESYLGRRVFDVLRVLDLLTANGATDIRVVGRGLGSVTAAFVGLLHPSHPRVELRNHLPSYELIAATPQHTWPLSCLLRGVLKAFDLPDVYRALGKRLTMHAPWNARMRPLRTRRQATA